MPFYRSLNGDWVFVQPRTHRDNDWKVGMLAYRLAKAKGLLDLHIITTKPSSVGSYSDAHVTFVISADKKEHIHYQVNNDKLVADYVLAPHGWRASYWVNFPALKETTEAEILRFVNYWRSEGKLDKVPTAVS